MCVCVRVSEKVCERERILSKYPKPNCPVPRTADGSLFSLLGSDLAPNATPLSSLFFADDMVSTVPYLY